MFANSKNTEECGSFSPRFFPPKFFELERVGSPQFTSSPLCCFKLVWLSLVEHFSVVWQLYISVIFIAFSHTIKNKLACVQIVAVIFC